MEKDITIAINTGYKFTLLNNEILGVYIYFISGSVSV